MGIGVRFALPGRQRGGIQLLQPDAGHNPVRPAGCALKNVNGVGHCCRVGHSGSPVDSLADAPVSLDR